MGPDETPTRLRRVLRNPVTRLVLFLAALAVALLVHSVILGWLRSLAPSDTGLLAQTVGVAVLVALVLLAYVTMVRALERRHVDELAIGELAPQVGVGLLLGFGLITAVAAALWLGGLYEIVGVGTPSAGGGMLLLAIASGTVEEILVRGVLFRILEEGLGTWISLAATAALFGALHLANPNAGWMGAITIAATAGVVLAGTYVWTRSLWTPIGMHIAWNFTEGGVYGMPVSGLDQPGMVQARLQGPELLTGGPFGPEASIITLALGVALGAWILHRAVRRGHVVRPFWRRR